HHHAAGHGSFSPVDKSRVLVVSASMGGGHDGAGRELLRRLRDRGHAAQMVDFLDAFPMRMGWLVRAGYWLELRYAPWSYEATYPSAPPPAGRWASTTASASSSSSPARGASATWPIPTTPCSGPAATHPWWCAATTSSYAAGSSATTAGTSSAGPTRCPR